MGWDGTYNHRDTPAEDDARQKEARADLAHEHGRRELERNIRRKERKEDDALRFVSRVQKGVEGW